MRRTVLIFIVVVFAAEAPAHAIIFDTIMGGINYAQEMAYQAFMKLKVIEEIRILKENYDTSVRYYNEFKRLNQGRGLLYNVGEELKATGKQMDYELQSQIDRDFIHTYNTNTDVDRFFQNIDRGIASNMKYAGDEIANVISDRKTGIDIARNSQGLSPKDAANLAAKGEGIQIQIMAQIHEDNLRLIQIQTMQLANDTRKQESEQTLINTIRKSAEFRAQPAQDRGNREP